MADYLDSYRGKVVLVTGGAGAIGSNLVRGLAAAGARVIVLDDLSSAERWNVPSLPGVLFVQGDVLDEVKLKRVFFERPEIVFHLAAFFANQNSVDHPQRDLMVNGLGTLRVLIEYSASPASTASCTRRRAARSTAARRRCRCARSSCRCT